VTATTRGRPIVITARLVLIAALATGSALWASQRPESPVAEWRAYGGSPANDRFSALTQINRANVRQLEVAWTFDTAETGGFQVNPIVVDGVMYSTTPRHRAIALDAATGTLKWTFDAGIESRGPNRGVTYWRDGDDHRVFVAVDQFLYALDARTGRIISTFGDQGRIDLRRNLGRDPERQSIRLTTPGVVFKDLLIIGGRAGEGAGASPGDIRAYEAKSGQLKWSFRTIPKPGEDGYDTWSERSWQVNGGANNWAGMAVDESRGIVFVPTGSAAPDFYGADRIGDNLFANALLALDAATGRRLWHFQAVHHDIWDRDFPSPPTLVTIRRGGRSIDAVAQTTKHGFVFVFDRENGRPLFPIDERPFPASDISGEKAAPTQPVPSLPKPFARQRLTPDLLTTRTPEAHAWAVEQLATFRNQGPFTPLAVGQSTVVFPGFDGGAEWGGSAFDPASTLLFVNANDLAWTGALAPDTSATQKASGYRFTGYRRFLDPDGYPATATPWGTLSAINLSTGDFAWQIPLGEYPELVAQGLNNTGSENYGGPIVTAGGLVFIGATNFDRKFRAFDKDSGQLLWEATLPLAANTTPLTYELRGRQFVLVPAGGGKNQAPSGGVFIAYALPDNARKGGR
jgi:glucose dehydrogenase